MRWTCSPSGQTTTFPWTSTLILTVIKNVNYSWKTNGRSKTWTQKAASKEIYKSGNKKYSSNNSKTKRLINRWSKNNSLKRVNLISRCHLSSSSTLISQRYPVSSSLLFLNTNKWGKLMKTGIYSRLTSRNWITWSWLRPKMLCRCNMVTAMEPEGLMLHMRNKSSSSIITD